MAYYLTVDRILGQQSDLDLNLAMRQAAVACGRHGGLHHERETTTPHRTYAPWSMPYGVISGTYIQQSTPMTRTHTQKHTDHIVAGLEPTPRHIGE